MFRTIMLTLALTLTAASIEAQTCLGRPAAGRNYLAAGVSRTSMDAIDFNAIDVTYARQSNLWLPKIEGDSSRAWLAFGLSTGGYDVNESTLDASATRVNGTYTIDWDTRGALPPGVSLCGTTGLGITAFSEGNGTYVAVPLTLSGAYVIPLGNNGELSPFAAPTIAAYVGEFEDDMYRYTEKGTDFYMDLGAALRFGRIATTAAYRIGDLEHAEHPRLTFSAGYTF